MIEAAKERFSTLPHVRAQVADVHDLPFQEASFDSVLVFHTLTYAERPPRALEECARVLRPGGRMVILTLDAHQQREVTAPYGERHAGFSPSDLRAMLAREKLDVVASDVACREAKKPHFQVVLAIADKPTPGPSKNAKRG
jgi:ubiquinone/menaquinone biosynthesis C-methylase UbiE